MKAVPAEEAKEMVDLQDIEIERYLKEAIDIMPEALEEEFVRIPADLAYWNEKFAAANREHLAAKIERERLSGELMIDPEFIAELEENLGKKPSIDQIKAAILNDKRYIAIRQHEAASEAEKVRLRGCVDAVASKRDMVISLGAHVRLEMQHDPVLRSRMAGLREIQDNESES